MSIIEQAARRLEELRRSGVAVPPPHVDARVGSTGASRHAPAPRPVAREAAPTAARDAKPPVSRQVHIDLARLADMGYLTPDKPRTQIADEFRIIKRPLLNNVLGRSAAPVERSNLLMVTSALPGEGKTFVSVNLALSLAMELDTTVLLVDADVSRPSVLSRLGLPPAPGLLDVLADPSLPLSRVLLRTQLETLSILPAGTAKGHATELLASDSMKRLVSEMAQRYMDRILVFDAPPLLPSPESRVLATHMGQVIVVVEAERTRQKTVMQALATIEACPVVMPMLNKSSRSDVADYYGNYAPLDA